MIPNLKRYLLHVYVCCHVLIINFRMLEVEHPAAKVLVELAHLQDEEVGDGTTSVVIIAAELLKVRFKLFKQGSELKLIIINN